jgi:DNA-binding PadR family transcriptional regulator
MHIPDKRLLDKGKRREFEKQMMRHMLSTFLLWFISKKPTHGYEIIKSLEGEEGFRVMTASQLYPLLKELTKAGLIFQQKEMQGKRARKTYHVTEKGLEALRAARKMMQQKPLKRQFLKEMVQ